MNGNPWKGFVAGIGMAACLFGLQACLCLGCGDGPPERIPEGDFVLDEAIAWSGEVPEEIQITYDEDTFTLSYTAAARDDEPGAADVRLTVVYRVVDLDVR